MRAALERLGERAAPVPALTTGDPGDIPDGIVHDDVRDQLRRLADKWGSTPKFVLRCAVTVQVVKAWKDELEDTGPESGEMHYNVSTAPDDTSTMLEPGYAEEVADEPPSMRDEDADDDGGEGEPDETLVSERVLPKKPTKH